MTLDEVVAPFEDGHREFNELSPSLWQPLGVALVRCAAPAPGERVLDACCGDGASAIPAARAVGPGGHVDAVDGAGALLDHGRAAAADLPQLRFVRADVIGWQPETGPYDLVQCAYGVFFFPDMDAACRRLVRLLRPGGRFAVSAWRYPALRAFASCLIESVEEERGEPLPKPAGLHPAERIDSREKIGDWLTSLGLIEVQAWSIPFQHSLDDHEFAWKIVTGTGFRGMLAAFDSDGVERVRNATLRRIEDKELRLLDASSVVAVGKRP